jgi:general secretion pathway protein K
MNRGAHLRLSGVKLLSLPTFFAAAKKVGAAPHRGNANKPIRKQGKAKKTKKQKNKKQQQKPPRPQGPNT